MIFLGVIGLVLRTVSFKLDDSILDMLEEASRSTGRSKSEIIREALVSYLVSGKSRVMRNIDVLVEFIISNTGLGVKGVTVNSDINGNIRNIILYLDCKDNSWMSVNRRVRMVIRGTLGSLVDRSTIVCLRGARV